MTEIKLTLKQIQEDSSYIEILNSHIKKLIVTHGSAIISNLIEIVHSDCPELKQYCDDNDANFKKTSVKDKGLVGKIVEFYLFGNLPNSNSKPDTIYGDIKTTHFKCFKANQNAFNAKERLTLTNIGDPNKEEIIALIQDKNNICETKFYEKIKRGIILVLQHDQQVYDTIESIYNKKIISIVLYNLDDVFEKQPHISNMFQEDFNKIKTCIVEKNVTQKGQKYLHLHKHGCKHDVTRAFGFTNRFLTKLVSIYMDIELQCKGNSEFIDFSILK